MWRSLATGPTKVEPPRATRRSHRVALGGYAHSGYSIYGETETCPDRSSGGKTILSSGHLPISSDNLLNGYNRNTFRDESDWRTLQLTVVTENLFNLVAHCTLFVVVVISS
jgi:hypothetical protein